jgi:hypothetical protein
MCPRVFVDLEAVLVRSALDLLDEALLLLQQRFSQVAPVEEKVVVRHERDGTAAT